MPNPLIFLENHFDQSAKDFLIQNIHNLKQLGYKKVLFELQRDLSPQVFKQQCQLLLQRGAIGFHGDQKKAILENTSFLLTLFTTLENAGVAYEFIDPQSHEEAAQFNRLALNASSPAEFQAVEEQIKKVTRQRDDQMAVKIQSSAMLYEGGIIYLGGFMHSALATHLRNAPHFNYRVIIFSNAAKYPATINKGTDELTWPQLSNPVFRRNFYQTDVVWMDNPLAYAFEIIENVCGFTSKHGLKETPAIGSFFNHAIEENFQYEKDDFHVLAAYLETEDTQKINRVVIKIQDKFSGLYFQVEQKERGKKIAVAGLNVPNYGKLINNRSY